MVVVTSGLLCRSEKGQRENAICFSALAFLICEPCPVDNWAKMGQKGVIITFLLVWPNTCHKGRRVFLGVNGHSPPQWEGYGKAYIQLREFTEWGGGREIRRDLQNHPTPSHLLLQGACGRRDQTIAASSSSLRLSFRILEREAEAVEVDVPSNLY